MEPWNFRAGTNLCPTLIQTNTYSSKKFFLIKKAFYILGVKFIQNSHWYSSIT